MFEPPYFPIVLIRGFAARDSDIEAAANQVFLGYEEGSTKTRQDAAGAIRPFFFESVVLRLMKDHGYELSHRNNLIGYEVSDLDDQGAPDASRKVGPKSIWTHRYYDLASKTYDGHRLPMEAYARDLRQTIVRICDKVCGRGADAATKARRKAFRVHLVAHSQGGLVARSYLQKVAREAAGAGDDLHGGGKAPVASLFTYGAPHGGIEFLDMNVPDLGPLSALQARNFNRAVIREYLGLDEKADTRNLNGSLEPERAFCIIGTNWKDYDQVSKNFTRELSDGLVMAENAYVFDDSGGQKVHAARAYVSRAHGGPFGMVNSEEGYQNLRRFLFGDWRVDLDIVFDAIRLPDNLLAKLKTGQTAQGNYVLDVIASVRGQQVKLHERRNETSSGVRFPVVYKKTASGQSTLFDLRPENGPDPHRTISTLFLISALSAEPATQSMEMALSLNLEKPVFEIDGFAWLKEHIEGLSTLNRTYRIRLEPPAAGSAGRVVHAMIERDGLASPETELENLTGDLGAAGGLTGEIGFGPPDAADLKSGEAKGRVIVRVRRRKVLD